MLKSPRTMISERGDCKVGGRKEVHRFLSW